MRVVLCFLLVCASFALADDVKQHTVTGDLEIVPITSKILGNTRNLRILLPPGYRVMQNRHSRYPVMYMQDGQNLFDAATSYFHEWQVDETMQRLWAEHKVPPMIIVGIDNAQEKRADEYLPYRDEYNPQVKDPRAADYARFMLEEVMPYVEKHYRVKTGAENTGIGGSSYGGVISLYMVMQHPGMFGRLLLESTSLHISNERLLQDALQTKQWPKRVFIGIGTKETDYEEFNPKHVAASKKLAEILHTSGLGDDRVKLVVVEGARHNEDAWAARLPEAMEFLWGG